MLRAMEAPVSTRKKKKVHWRMKASLNNEYNMFFYWVLFLKKRIPYNNRGLDYLLWKAKEFNTETRTPLEDYV